MNKLDSELVLGELVAQGFEIAPAEDEADVVLYNTCSVRAHAEQRVYSRMGRLKFLKKRRPEIIIGLIGCMARSEQKEIFRRLPHIDLAVGPGEFNRIGGLIEDAASARKPILAVDDGIFEYHRRPVPDKTRFQAYLSIMRGCDNFCSYCVVPYTRGRERSRPMETIVDEAKRLVDAGVKEITLLGQNVSSYGKGLPEDASLAALLRRLDGMAGLERIRFVTSHPKDMSDDLLRVTAECPSVCEYLHMPAQSGSDGILKAMRRGYTRAAYEELIAKARAIVPGVEITSDFIVGFPGETNEDFNQTLDLVENAGFLNTFVFKYSPRPRTRAAKLEDDVPDEVKRERNNALLGAQKKVAARRQRAWIGKTVEVLAEGPSKRDKSRFTGRTRQNHIVVFPAEKGLSGRSVSVRIVRSTPLTLYGETV
jgi:tRNA-2-methylthio-N6-dimethylallyladenosine synthase